MELTATVVRVVSETVFVVADTDLPADGQVIVSDTPVTVRITDVVTVGGRVEEFDAAAFARYIAHRPGRIRPQRPSHVGSTSTWPHQTSNGTA